MVQRLLKNSTVKVTEALQAALMEYANQKKAVVGAEGILVALAMAIISEMPQFQHGQVSQIRMTKDVENLFEAADRERRRIGDTFISTGALFLGCFDRSVPGTLKILEDVGLQ